MAAEHDVDKLVQSTFFKGAKEGGVLVEVGAARPNYLSISESFRALGWKIIAVEPNPVFCEEHRKLGHEILQYACSDHDEDEAEFYIVKSIDAVYMGGEVSYESWSSLGIRDRYAEVVKTVEDKTEVEPVRVKLRKLDTIMREHAPEVGEIDVLAIDVEGWEVEVLRGFSLDRYRPKVAIIENLFLDGAYEEHMKQFGYSLWETHHPNQIYVRNDILAAQA
ncbi:FkbM family methyltransferase [Methylobacterium durans]|uniref:FkbM family methyltransferase n=1 Tax=Methylobacterium durans TaxID=2202825 RepID=A0A2U8WE42_9HYPH|nr:FkbM family methyltransferase [Methylobacterium durans]AWN43798.1 FkbM family methyltransferase [Methylobacterium durans]